MTDYLANILLYIKTSVITDLEKNQNQNERTK